MAKSIALVAPSAAPSAAPSVKVPKAPKVEDVKAAKVVEEVSAKIAALSEKPTALPSARIPLGRIDAPPAANPRFGHAKPGAQLDAAVAAYMGSPEVASLFATFKVTHGSQIPILVRRVLKKGQDKAENRFVIVEGWTRYMYAKQTGTPDIAAVELTGSLTDGELLARRVMFNTARNALNPVAQAAAYGELLKTYGTTKKVAEACGVSAGHVAATMRITFLPASIVKLVGNGTLSAAAAQTLAEMPGGDDCIRYNYAERSGKALTGGKDTVNAAIAFDEIATKIAKLVEQDSAANNPTTTRDIARHWNNFVNEVDEDAAPAKSGAAVAAVEVDIAKQATVPWRAKHINEATQTMCYNLWAEMRMNPKLTLASPELAQQVTAIVYMNAYRGFTQPTEMLGFLVDKAGNPLVTKKVAEAMNISYIFETMVLATLEDAASSESAPMLLPEKYTTEAQRAKWTKQALANPDGIAALMAKIESLLVAREDDDEDETTTDANGED